MIFAVASIVFVYGYYRMYYTYPYHPNIDIRSQDPKKLEYFFCDFLAGKTKNIRLSAILALSLSVKGQNIVDSAISVCLISITTAFGSTAV